MISSKKSIINTAVLYTARILQMLFPLLILPFVARHLSLDEYGKIVTVQAAASLITAIVEYGFNYTGSRDLATALDNHDEFNRVFNKINSSKIVLFFIALIVISIYVFLNPSISSLFVFIIGLVLAQGFSPYWAFQAVGNVIPFAISEFISKLLIFLSILLLLNSGISPVSFLVINTVFPILASLALMVIFVKRYNITPIFYEPLSYIKNSFNMFVFRVGSIAYSSGSTAVLSLVVPASQVAIYGGADRFFRATSMFLGPIGEVIFPRISYLLENDLVKAKRYQRYGFVILFLLSLALSTLLFIMSPYIISYFLGSKYSDSVDVLRILSLNVLLIGIGTAIGVVYIIPRKLDNIFATATSIAGVWNIFSILFLVPKLGIRWMAWSINISEILLILTCVTFIILRRKNA